MRNAYQFAATLSVVVAVSLNTQAESHPHNSAGNSVLHSQAVDDREVYIITSKINGTFPKIGPARHASIAICPHGVPPVIYENGVPVSNCAQCDLYGTQMMERGFRLETKKRIDAKATKVCGISATTAEQRIKAHCRLNVPILDDCRHHVIQVLGIRTPSGRLKPARRLK